MACFLVGAAEAAVVTAVSKAMEKHEAQKTEAAGFTAESAQTAETSIPWSRKLSWLARLLWGGAVLLAFEHVWHGEVVPWFPFLTAMLDPGDTAEMLHEMATIGVTMAVIVTAAWLALCFAADAIVRRVPDGKAEAVS